MRGNGNPGGNYASAIKGYIKRRPRLRTSFVSLRNQWYSLQLLYLILVRKAERKIAVEAMPILGEFVRGRCSITEEMRAEFTEYTNTVSFEGMPISFETACLLWSLCEATHPKRILDMGSGFSSFLFRRYQSTSQSKPEVWSVDENTEWLEKTRTYLSSRGLSDDKLISGAEFQAMYKGRFDLISLDLGHMSRRPDIFEELLELRNPEGLIILDDLHNSEYRTEISRRLKSQSAVAGYSVRWLTLDKFLRYCLLVRPSPEANKS